MKPERIQSPARAVTPERLRQQKREIGEWQVDPTPNAITRHFPQPSFSASAAFLTKVAPQVDKHGRMPHVTVGATGVTVRLGNPPAPSVCAPEGRPGVTEADLELAAAFNAIA